MLTIKDYTGGTETVHGPFNAVRFYCLNQSFPSYKDPTVTYMVLTTDNEYQMLTVSMSHFIEPVQKEKE